MPDRAVQLRTANDIVVAPDGSPWFSVDTLFGAGTREGEGYADICSTTPELEPGPCTTVDTSTVVGGHLSGGPTVGPDGAIWFTNRYERFVGRIPATGQRVVARYKMPGTSRPEAITTGPDGAVWFGDEERGLIGRLTTDGAYRFFALPRNDSSPSGIAAGPDGAVWFTEAGSESSAVGRITPDGQITRFPIPAPNSRPTGIALGPDGATWFTENGASKIGRIEPPPGPGPGPAGSDESKPRA